MRRPLLAGVGVLTALFVVVAAALAATVGAQRGDVPGDRMTRMMGAPAWGEPGRDQGQPGWMHGMTVRTEFAYLAEMVAHHEEAVAAAEELRRSKRPRMRAFGESIVRTQSAQIEQMEGWLAQWYAGRSTDVDYEPMMRDLSGLSGAELDRAFLEDMIPHHMAAVMMSQQLLVRGVADHAAVEDLAESIRDEQHAEIFRMQRWLADWFGVGWAHGMGRRAGSGHGMGPGMMW